MAADRCTAGPLSDWLNGLIGVCCDLHDQALDHTLDLGTFVQGNLDFAHCVAAVNPLLAAIVFLAVSGPVGAALYWLGPKRKPEGDAAK